MANIQASAGHLLSNRAGPTWRVNKGHLYFIGADVGPIKIGCSHNPKARLKDLQTASPYKLRLLAILEDGGHEEAAYHRWFAADRLHGEWFQPSEKLLAEIADINRNQRIDFPPQKGRLVLVASRVPA